MGLTWRKRRDSGKAFIVRPKGGKTVSQSFNKSKNEELTREELKRVLQSRKIDEKEIIPEDEIKDAQQQGKTVKGRLISLHPTNPELSNIFVIEDSPQIYDESELNKSLDLREEQNRLIAEEKGLEIQDDIDKMRMEENMEKANKKDKEKEK